MSPHQMTLDEKLQATLTDYFWIPDHVQVVDESEISFCWSEDPNWFNHVSRLSLPADLTRAHAESITLRIERAHQHGSSRYFMAEEWIRPALIESIEDHGLRRTHSHRACGLDVQRYRLRDRPDLKVLQVQTVEELRMAHHVGVQAFEKEHSLTSEEAEQLVALLQGSSPRSYRFLVLDRANDEPLSSGGLNVYPQLKMGLMWGGGTVPGARGRGAYGASVDARIQLARSLGLDTLALYAREGTSLPVMLKLGARLGSRMSYWERPRRSLPDE